MAFIRLYKPSDFESTAYICRATLPPSLSASKPAIRIAPYLWTHQYTLLSPTTCFVLDDGSGSAVGYVIGCPDVFAFADTYPRYVDEILTKGPGGKDVPVPKQLVTKDLWTVPSQNEAGKEVVNEECLAQTAYNPKWLLLEGVQSKAELVAAYRATMHIDLLPPYQGKGWGKKMIAIFMQSVKEAVEAGRGVIGKGVHIGVSGENTKVVPFYERLGLRVYEGVEREGNVWMVYDLE